MFQVSVTLPKRQNDGKSNQFAISNIEMELARTYGGFSAQDVLGGWIDEETGVFYLDESTLVWTFVHTLSAADAILERSRQWAIDLQQIELLVTTQELVVHFVKGISSQEKAA